MSSSPSVILKKPVKLACVQLASGTDKEANLKHAAEQVASAAQRGSNIVVLPECFNSPYGHVHFPVYAEKIGFVSGQPYDIEKSESDSVKMLSAAAKEVGSWLIGG